MALHIAFWVVYWLLVGYVESVLAGSSAGSTSFWARARIGYTVELLVLPVKMLLAYYFLYGLIPEYLRGKNRWITALKALLSSVLAIVAFRWITYFVIYPFIYEEQFEWISFSAQLPRLLWSFFDIFTVVGFASAIKLARGRIAALEKEKQLVEEKLQSELNYLKAQVNPHFLFNTLNNLYGLARKRSDKTADAVIQLSKLLRFMLYECAAERIPLSREIKVIQDYLALERLRYSERLSLDYREEVEDQGRQIAPLLMIPLIENAFTHGVSETRKESFVRIWIKEHQGIFELQIENSYDQEALYGKEGLGLQNVRRQLESIYPGRHRFIAKATPDYFYTHLLVRLTDDGGRPTLDALRLTPDE